MPRAPTTADVFNAIAELRRRQILELLAQRGALTVGVLVETLGLPQPAVSKHLGVLRKVGVVAVTKQGKQRVYNLEAEKLKTVHDWVKAFEALWSHQLDRIKVRANKRNRLRPSNPGKDDDEIGQSTTVVRIFGDLQGDRDFGTDRDRLRGHAGRAWSGRADARR